MIPASILLDTLRHAALLPADQQEQADRLASHPALAAELVARGWLTPFQGEELAAGRGFSLAVGAYVLVERLGAGGMGEVFKARHRVMGREVALKRILPGRMDSPAAIARFEREVN